VVANRVASVTVEPPSIALRPWRVERRRFSGALRRLAARHRVLVFADVAACYPSIGPPVVGDVLRDLGCSCAMDVERFLRRTQDAGIAGLPVGPAPSALFANAVLGHLDRAIASAELEHLRWVDDLVIGVARPGGAGSVLRVVRAELGRIGLRLNEAKTRVVVDPGALIAAPSRLRGAGVRLR
jgi:hypothetical protein